MVPNKQSEYLEKLTAMQVELTQEWHGYWTQFSNMGTWQFWFNVAMLIVPLILIYLFIDKKRALQLGFFGFNVHVWFTYIDILGVKYGLWVYPFQIYTPLPISFSLDASLVPVTYMFVYQWVLKHQKNYYLVMIPLAALFAFAFKPLLVALDLFQLNKGTNYVHLFLGYVVITLLSRWITNVFVGFRNNAKTQRNDIS